MSHDVISVLLDILIVLVAAKVAAEGAERLNVPPVVGEIVAGIVVGPSVLGLVGNGDVLRTLGELGVVLLLLEVGMEMDLAELGRVGKVAMVVATIGVVTPLVLGLGAMLVIGDDFNTALFVAAALTATSVGITARVFGDLGALSTSEARVVLGAAVADDVMGLIVLTVVVRVVTEGTIEVSGVAVVLLGALAFLVVGGALALWLAPHLFSWIERISRSAGTLVALALAFTLALAELADVAGLAVVVGAFIAGLALGRTRQSARISRELAPVGHLFIPVFFLAIGIDVDVSAFAQVSVLRDAAILLAVAIVGKLVAGVGVAGTRNDRLLVGIGMLPRGEVGLIFATIGLNAGILGGDLYAALLLVVLATTLGTPVVLRARYQALARRPQDAEPDAGDDEPTGGWFVVRDGSFVLVARPGARRTLELALEAARLAAHAEPDAATVDWFADHRATPLEWSSRATGDFFAVLRDGNVRSWRFLEALGVLPRAFPELDDALRDRHADPALLDSMGLHRWTTLERLQEVAGRPDGAQEWERSRHRDALRLTAFLVDVLRDRAHRTAVARQVVERLDLGARAERLVTALVGDPTSLLDVARRRGPIEQHAVVQLAAHYSDPEMLRGAFLFATGFAGDAFDRERVREVYRLVADLLRSANWRGDATSVIEQRRSEAELASDGTDAVLRRIADAPRHYLLAERPRRIARHAALLSKWAGRGSARYLVSVEPPSRHDGRVAVDVVAPDSPGLLARVASVIARAGLDVENAVIATWPDGCALESFLLRPAEVVDGDALREAVRIADAEPIAIDGVPGSELEFDDQASPWSTRLRVRAPDVPGLLGAVTGAIAAAGVEVHAAEIASDGSTATDTFEVSQHGAKLGPAARAAIAANLQDGVVLPRRRRWLGRTWDRLRGSWTSASTQEIAVST